MAEEPTPDAIQIAEDMAFAALGVRGLGRWFAIKIQNPNNTLEQLISAVRYGTDSSPEGQAVHQAYLTAFPGMDRFLKDQIFPGDSPEVQYMNYRRDVREAAARYGISSNLVTNEKIAEYISQRNSALEIVNRMGLAAEAVASTPPETMRILKDYYGVQTGDLISFYLSPDETEAQLKKKYTAAQIGSAALQRQFEVERTFAESLADRGYTMEQAQGAFEAAAQQRTLTAGAGETVTNQQLVEAATGDVESGRTVRRVAGSRQARFQAGGELLTQAGGVAGLGTSQTR
jgi:hypothetical protein